MRLSNSSKRTLPPGPVALFADGGFAGESAIDRLKPGERRIVEFGVDLDLELQSKESRVTEEVRQLTFEHDHLEEHYLRRTDTRYALENRSGLGRSVFLALGVVKNATVTGASAPSPELGAQGMTPNRLPTRVKASTAPRNSSSCRRACWRGWRKP